MAFLKIISGTNKGKKIQIDRDEVVIGRAPENLVCIDDGSISGRHCMIRRDGRRFTLTDLKSTNGTYLNDVKIESYRLSAKDTIMVGSIKMIFDGDDIEDAKVTTIAPTIVRPAPKKMVRPVQEPGAQPSAFVKRKSGKGVWVAVIAVLGIAGIVALVWFVKAMLGSGS